MRRLFTIAILAGAAALPYLSAAALAIDPWDPFADIRALYIDATNRIAELNKSLAEAQVRLADREAQWAALSNRLAAVGSYAGRGGFAAATNDLEKTINGNEDLRRAAHGGLDGQVILTNELGRIYAVRTYADGYSHLCDGEPRRALTPETRRRLAEESQRRALVRLEKEEAAKFPAEVAALLAERRRALGITNVVTVTVEGAKQ